MNLTSIARPYAKAAFEYAAQSNTLQQWSEGLALAAEIVELPEIKRLFNNPTLDDKDLFNVLSDLLKIEQQNLVNFFKLLVEHHRLEAVPFILQEFIKLKASYDQTLTVEVMSAMPLEEAQQQAMRQALEKRYGKQVLLSHEVNAQLIAGALIRIGDTVIDGSVKGRLANLREYLKGDQV